MKARRFPIVAKLKIIRTFLGGLFAALLAAPPSAHADENLTMIFATVGTSRNDVRVEEGQLNEQHPGWFVELSRRAAEQCGANVGFAFVPWSRALEMVKRNNVSAAFHSSFKAARAKYGAYPFKDGKLDVDRASRNYAYHAYVAKSSKDKALIGQGKFQGRRIVAERGAAIVPLLRQRGAKISQVAGYLSMLRIVAGNRVDAAVGIDFELDGVLARHPDLAALVEKVRTPVLKSVGYVMFSKAFYAAHGPLVECFWTTSAHIRDGNWFKDLRASYR